MNIWSILGISVALVAGFCIAVAELLQSTLFYELHKKAVCASLIILGGVVYGIGRYLHRRLKARYAASQAELPEGERDKNSREWQPFLLFNLEYWGVMVASFGCIIVFFVPTYSKLQKATVAARGADTERRKPRPTPAPPPTNVIVAKPLQIPKFNLQGVTLRENAPSALIDGRTYFVGDWIKDGQLLSIDSNGVVLAWREIKVILQAPK